MIKVFKLVLGLTGAAWLGLIALPATADCVRENLASSEALKSNAPYFDPNGTSSSQQRNYTPPLPSQRSRSDSGPACGYKSLEAADRAAAAC